MARDIINVGGGGGDVVFDRYRSLSIAEGLSGDPQGLSYACKIITGKPVSPDFCREKSNRFSSHRDFCSSCQSPYKVKPGSIESAPQNAQIPFGMKSAFDFRFQPQRRGRGIY